MTAMDRFIARGGSIQELPEGESCKDHGWTEQQSDARMEDMTRNAREYYQPHTRN